MPHEAPLRSGDPRRVGPYQLARRLEGIPSDDPIFVGASPDGTDVAITVLSGEWALDGAARDRFAAEAAVAKRVPPFCAARVLDAGLDGSAAYLVSEYVRGQSLLELVSADGVRRGPDLEAVAIGMATGLASVHQAGLVHGNFGPEYVILAADGSPRVVEFGITPPYGSATPSADMMAWAQTVVFAASGHPPATFEDLANLPDELRSVVERCLDPEPGGRPAARTAVQSLLGSQPLRAGLLAEGSRRAVRHPRSSYDDYPAASDIGHGAAPGRSGPARATASLPRESLASASAPSGHPPANPAAAVRHARRGFGRRRAGLVITAAIVAVIVAGVVALRILLGSGNHAGANQLSADTGQTSHSPKPSASSTHRQGPPIPAAFDGVWTGVVTQPPTDTYNVTVTFTTGQPGGTISYTGTDLSCSGALTPTRAAPQKLVASQGIIQGQSKCGNGLATITLTGTNKLWFSFHSNGPIASGTLVRH
jgi:hypothetical protein